MKKIALAFLLVLGFAVLTGCLMPSGASRSSGSSGTATTTGAESEINTVFTLTNAFRTGNEAYFWNKDNRTKTNLVGQLERLTLDDDLCRAAEIRAREIVRNFSHTRPDGRGCGTVLDDLSIGWRGRGENIAAGNASGSATFTQWKEDDKDYSGQGHRRNMLGDFTKIGIARAYDPNSTYRYYWVMILTK